jgi:multiple sugar transport system permease protein
MSETRRLKLVDNALSSSPGKTKSGKKIRWIDIKEGIVGYLFILPAVIIIGLFGLFPIGFATYVSMFQWRINPGDYTGLSNYTKALDNLAYVLGFWLAIVLVYLAIRNIIFVIKLSRDRNEQPWIWIIPGVITSFGIYSFIRFLILLLPEILAISTRVRGLAKTQELFLQLLGEAWRTPIVVRSRTFALLVLAIGFISAILIGLFIYKSTRNSQYYLSSITNTALIGFSVMLFWLTWTQIQAAYLTAQAAGESLDIWSQIIIISLGFVLLLFSWLAWRSANQKDTNLNTALRLFAGVILAIGAWVLIAELPREVMAGDKNWWQGLLVTVYYSIGTVPIQLGISLLLSVLLFQNIRGKGLFRLIYFLPYITPTVAAAAVFRVFFSGRPNAPINSLIQVLGGHTQLWLAEPKGIFQMIAGPDITLPTWLVGPSLALVVIIIYNIWAYVGYDTVIFLAGLGNIPTELYEAASIDGANKIAQFRHITLPLLSPTTYFLTLLSIIGTFKAFNHIWVLRSGAALGTTDTATVVIFTEFSRNTRYGYAAALSIVLLGVILILTLVNNKMAEKRVFYG